MSGNRNTTIALQKAMAIAWVAAALYGIARLGVDVEEAISGSLVMYCVFFTISELISRLSDRVGRWIQDLREDA